MNQYNFPHNAHNWSPPENQTHYIPISLIVHLLRDHCSQNSKTMANIKIEAVLSDFTRLQSMEDFQTQTKLEDEAKTAKTSN